MIILQVSHYFCSCFFLSHLFETKPNRIGMVKENKAQAYINFIFLFFTVKVKTKK